MSSSANAISRSYTPLQPFPDFPTLNLISSSAIPDPPRHIISSSVAIPDPPSLSKPPNPNTISSSSSNKNAFSEPSIHKSISSPANSSVVSGVVSSVDLPAINLTSSSSHESYPISSSANSSVVSGVVSSVDLPASYKPHIPL
ncbi:uncharacterized protein L3040_000288 [Drepanopeziza brunnea f. sp. 'multigermtubi']|uniref:uncharacterized protein n=1 Tax=Drepanopeziza brunnea f. sp. 'multigermtubi' TaxID=698441 RepID=UPI0023A314FC|nr:hypothetical protein L3040_000288 [Drepanopeziza brunnea f. sp. 'multigermtubi']